MKNALNMWLMVATVIAWLTWPPAIRADGDGKPPESDTNVTAVATATAALDALLDAGDAVWQLTPNQFMELENRNGFHWLSQNTRDTARSANSRLTFLGFRVWEAIARFDGAEFKEMTMSLYNHGDAGDISEAEFDRIVKRIDRQLDQWTGSQGFTFKREDRTSTVTVMRKTWVRQPHRLDLTWSFTPRHRESGVSVPFRAEFVRLRMSRANPEQVLPGTVPAPEAGPSRLVSAVDLEARVKRLANGDVLVTGIPMVDQGEKGYCAAAVAERVMRYYGRAVDQHEIAQLASTSASRGTTYEAMIGALRRISSHEEMEVRILNDFDYHGFARMMRDYNRLAKEAGQPQIAIPAGESPDLAAVFAELDAEMYKVARVKRHVGLVQFKASVKDYVSHGVPLVWSAIVGKIRETPRIETTGAFGHMRLIIGYNDRTLEILYTDTWGSGHELKRMSLDDAWTITLGLDAVLPRNVRF